jgi:hypothetical protein
MNSESLIIQEIVKANKNGNLAIFVGAGISKSSDTEINKMPDWSDLIKSIKKK